MKKSILTLFILALVFAFNNNARAQAGSATVTATTKIVSDLTVTKNDDLNFGKLASNAFNVNGDPSITPSGTAPNIVKENTGTDAQQGEVEITSDAGQGIIISFDNPANLSDGASPTAHTIPFTANYVGSNGDGEDALNAGGTTSVTTGDNNGPNPTNPNETDQKYFIYLGGSLASGSYPGGTYNGDIVVNVDFQ